MRRRLTALLLLAGALGACDERGGAGGAGVRADTTLLDRLGRPAEQGRVHLVRMVAHGDVYAFEPAEVRARTGDVVRFVLVGSQPESVAFDTLGLPAPAVEFLRGSELVEGSLLTQAGQIYEVELHGAPPGRYPFHSVPHAAQGMRGVLLVE